MDYRTALAGAAALGTAALAGVVVSRRRFARRVDGLVSALDRAGAAERPVSSGDYEDAPAPVRRYFRTVLEDGRPFVRRARLTQRGAMRLGGADSAWTPFTATQHVAADPPGFVWDATLDVAPFLPTRVVDAYVRGEGVLQARVLGAVPVADAAPGPDLDAGELARYLAEGVWVPTVLLPAAGVEWSAVDDRSARATLEHRGTVASLVFHFRPDGLVERVTGERPRETADGSYEPTPWTGRFGDYRDRDGVVVPHRGSVAWGLPDGDLRYWRGRLTDVEFGPQTGPPGRAP